MADTTARLAIDVDVDSSGVDSAAGGLERLRSQLKQSIGSLSQMESSLRRLGQSAEVLEFKRAEKSLGGLQKTLGRQRKAFEKVKAQFAQKIELGDTAGAEKAFAKGLDISGQIEATEGQIGGLQEKLAKLGATDAVKTFKDLEAAIGAERGKIAQGELQLAQLGETLEGTGDAGIDGAASFKKLAGALAPVGAAALAAAAGFAVLVLAITRFALAAADAGRSARLLREGVAGSAAGGRMLDTIMGNVADAIGGTRAEVQDLVLGFRRAGLAGAPLQAAAKAIAVSTAAAGDQVGSILKGIVDQSVRARRFVLNRLSLRGTGVNIDDVAQQLAKRLGTTVGAARAALQNGQIKLQDGLAALEATVGKRFGEVARRAGLALPKQLERGAENLSKIFEGANLDPLLEGLKEILDLLDESTVAGKALRQLAGVIFDPLAAEGGKALGGAAEGFKLVIIAAQELVIVALQARNALRKMKIPQELQDDLETLGPVFDAVGAAAFGLAIAIGAVVAAAAVGVAVISKPFRDAATAIGEVTGKLFELGDAASEAISTGKFRDAATSAIDGLVEGFTAGIGRVVEAAGNLGTAALKAFKKSIKASSPARLFIPAGLAAPQGVVKGIEAGTPQVESAAASMLAPIAALATPTANDNATAGGGQGAPALAAAAAPPSAGAAAPQAGVSLTIGQMTLSFPGITSAAEAQQLQETLDSNGFRDALAQALREALASVGGGTPAAEAAA